MRTDSQVRGFAAGVAAVALVLWCSLGPVWAEEAPPTVDVLLERVATSYEPVTTLRANFTQTSSGSSYLEPLTQKGTLSLKRPSKMHWDFQEPNRQRYITDGSTFWWVDEEAKTCTIYRQVDSTIEHFFNLLTGMADVKKDFDVSVASGSDARAGSDSLKLVAKDDTSGLGTLIVHISKETGLVTGVTNLTAFGDRTEMKLRDVDTGAAIPDEHFLWISRPDISEIEGG